MGKRSFTELGLGSSSKCPVLIALATLFALVNGQGLCTEQLAAAAEPDLPDCLLDGSFAHKQIDDVTGEEFCVDNQTGEEVSGTRVAAGESAGDCGEPAFPDIPASFSVILQLNIVNDKRSIDIFEHRDDVTNKVRQDQHNAGDIVSLLVLNNENEVFQSNSNNCTKFDLDNAPALFEGEDRELKTIEDLTSFAVEAGSSFQGVAEARGIPCERWFSQLVVGGGAAPVTTLSVEFFFADAEWQFKGLPQAERVLVRIILDGNTVITPPFGPPIVDAFEHYYEFIEFAAGTPDPSLFDVPSICLPPVDDDDDDDNDGMVLGLAIAGSFALAGVLGLGFGMAVQKRRQTRELAQGRRMSNSSSAQWNQADPASKL